MPGGLTSGTRMTTTRAASCVRVSSQGPRAPRYYQVYGSQGQGNISTLTGTLPGQRTLQRGVASDIVDYGEMWTAYLVDAHASEEERSEADMGASPRWEASLE
jgi:hypothetical protein